MAERATGAQGEPVREVGCACGRVYVRTVRVVGFRDNDAFTCRGCGVVLEEWRGSEIPVYTPAARAPTR